MPALLALHESARSMADTDPFQSTARRPNIEGPFQLEEVQLAAGRAEHRPQSPAHDAVQRLAPGRRRDVL